jgi:hypothetical protein
VVASSCSTDPTENFRSDQQISSRDAFRGGRVNGDLLHDLANALGRSLAAAFPGRRQRLFAAIGSFSIGVDRVEVEFDRHQHYGRALGPELGSRRLASSSASRPATLRASAWCRSRSRRLGAQSALPRCRSFWSIARPLLPAAAASSHVLRLGLARAAQVWPAPCPQFIRRYELADVAWSRDSESRPAAPRLSPYISATLKRASSIGGCPLHGKNWNQLPARERRIYLGRQLSRQL